MKIKRLKRRKLSCNERLGRLAMEFATAAAQVLQEQYQFDELQTNEFLSKVHEQAEQNRQRLETIGTVEALEKTLSK